MAKEYSYGICPYRYINGKFYILVNMSSRISDWNFFKGKQEDDETVADTAIREFYEETGVLVDRSELEDYFQQNSKRKNIGIFLMDFTNKDCDFHFDSVEIYDAEWFDVLSDIKFSNNQNEIYQELISYFKEKLRSMGEK